MSTIIRALEIAEEIGTCWYRPHNGDIIVNPKDEPRVILSRHIANWGDSDVREFYFEYGQQWVEEGWMKISIDESGGLTLSLAFEEDMGNGND
jgi:hypothetical protein